jgi:single-stranded DNA-specific DHH superfamily exonuclease
MAQPGAARLGHHGGAGALPISWCQWLVISSDATLGDPLVLPEMPAAVERILAAVDAKENVVLYGDYDVDGVTSMALMHLILKAYGLDTHLFLPTRMEEGYGLSHDGIAKCYEQFGKPDLLIALDCGTTSLSGSGRCWRNRAWTA